MLKKKFLLLMLKTVVLFNVFVESFIIFFQDSLNRLFKSMEAWNPSRDKKKKKKDF